MKKGITAQQRKHQDYLRRVALKTGAAYASRLYKLRRAEVQRVLKLCRDVDDFTQWSRVIENNLSESYLYDWQTGLYLDAGLPNAKSVLRDLSRGKASDPSGGVWESELRRFATERCGRNIVSVSGTMRNSLQTVLQNALDEDVNIGVEKLVKRITEEFSGINAWQARRIAQTETMIGLAESGNIAALTADVAFTKEWCISGVGNTRESHAAMDGVRVDQEELFQLVNSDGLICQMQYPHDTNSNAPAEQIINCGCSCIREPKWTAAQSASASAPTDVAADLTEEEIAIQKIMSELATDIPEDSRRAIAKNCIEIEKALGITKGAPMDIAAADESHANPLWKTSRAYQINCQTCSPVYLMRTRGFDVTAGPCEGLPGNLSYYLMEDVHFWEKYKNADGTPAKHVSVAEWRKAQKLSKMTSSDYLRFYDEHTKTPGIYEVAVYWYPKGGHSTILQRFPDGTLKRIDAQTWKQSVLDEIDGLCSLSHPRVTDLAPGVMRIDDKIFDPKFASIFSKVAKAKK